MKNQEIYKKLKDVVHFSFIPDEELKKIALKASIENLQGGPVIAEEGKTEIRHVYIVTRGQLSLYSEKKGKNFLAGYIKKNEVFGGISILLNAGISLRTVKADEDCEFIIIPEEIFTDLCARYESFYEYFLDNFSKHIFDDSLTSVIKAGHAKHFLSAIAPFSFLPPDEIDDIAQSLSIVKYPEGMVLFLQGRSRIGYLYILQKGSAEKYYEENRQKTMLELLSEGDNFGGISILMNNGISLRTLRITEDSYFYALPKAKFLKLCRRYEAFTEYFTDSFGKKMLNKSYASIIARTVLPGDEDVQIYNQGVNSILNKKVVFGKPRITIREAAKIMRDENSSFIIVLPYEDGEPGIVTEQDLSRKVIAEGYDIDKPAVHIMSSPLKTISIQAITFEALLIMMKENINHLVVTESGGKIAGVITNREFINARGQSPVFLLREIIEAEGMDDIISAHNKLPGIIKNLIAYGANAKNLTRFISTISDAILKKIMEYALETSGPPPADFAFMIFGSEGRNEQTLKTDQDNAIIYSEPLQGDREKARQYFLKLGNAVCAMLDRAGYSFCKGNIMAMNPKWCQPISVWKRYFGNWIHAGQPEDLLQASIFFDFRTGYGNNKLVEDLRDYLFASLKGWSGFSRYLTENTLYFKPPLGFFKNFVVESKGEHRNKFDIKRALMPIVDFARIYALNNKIRETNTPERLYQLYLKGILTEQDYDELEKAYGFLMQLRFVKQATSASDENIKPDNYINPKKLTNIEQTTLKEIFKRIEKFQARLEYEFIGTA